ncbi:hypothetical protein ACFSJU_14965 [Paradesertivirga mongoliensis]|uniref:Uncharacterized protein n=1 Tax=Paradesertivirga mongoliensis TaxID=2100740 RepID=A0ABW4ZP91_9SPHI|nr:hypothetical protein [Pedobacter mongoliensis]
MIQQAEQVQAAMVLPNVKFLPSEIIQKLSSLCENRNHALNAYPHAKGAAEKFATIAYIRVSLNHARGCLNPKDSAKICLNLELLFNRIAPSATSSLCKNYFKRLNPLMDNCRAYLNRRAQV